MSLKVGPTATIYTDIATANSYENLLATALKIRVRAVSSASHGGKWL